MKFTSSDLDALVASVLDTAKNRHVSPDAIRQIGVKELAAQSSLKAAIKETKNRLHQAAGAYLDRTPNYELWKTELAAAVDEATVRELSLSWMHAHSSTRERLPILDNFYRISLESLGRIDSVIDIACGLNPLAVLWMGLPEGVRYMAYDFYSDMTDFLSEYLCKVGVDGEAYVRNCAAFPPEEAADLALILKFLPVLEQIEKGSTLDWLKRINARAILISYPTRSLGGKAKGMARNYEVKFMDMVGSENWRIEKFEFANELCFLVRR
jgi:16S rRNA (guanine(1405)-N(7))-methyltransferase